MPSKLLTPGRLLRRSDFLRVQAADRKWIAPSVIIQASANDGTENGTGNGTGKGLRAGFTATKKLGGAVVRNRIKRRLRAAVRAALHSAHAPCDFDIVLIGRKETATCSFDALVRDIRWCLKKLSVTQSPEASHDKKSG